MFTLMLPCLFCTHSYQQLDLMKSCTAQIAWSCPHCNPIGMCMQFQSHQLDLSKSLQTKFKNIYMCNLFYLRNSSMSVCLLISQGNKFWYKKHFWGINSSCFCWLDTSNIIISNKSSLFNLRCNLLLRIHFHMNYMPGLCLEIQKL